jgi:hypothetical protein
MNTLGAGALVTLFLLCRWICPTFPKQAADARYAFFRVDSITLILIDVDIRNAEWSTVAAAAELPDVKVKCVYIGARSQFVENGLRDVFTRLGWFNVYDYPNGQDWPVSPGITVLFQDGAQYWANSRFVFNIPDGARVYPFRFQL